MTTFTRRPSTASARLSLRRTSPTPWSVPRMWCETWNRRWDRRTFPSCSSSGLAPTRGCGSAAAAGLLLLISGTHGVEGFCGSGCQVALLHDPTFIAEVERSGIAVLMLHALNPYGFSHLRRVNEDNADLNRNFVDFGSPLPVNRAYALMHSLLLPATWPPPGDSETRLNTWIAQHGRKAYQAAVSGGQYQYPDGF